MTYRYVGITKRKFKIIRIEKQERSETDDLEKIAIRHENRNPIYMYK